MNSLYPFAMLNPIPHEIIKFHDDLTNSNIDDLFGFFRAEIITPKNLIYPLLPYKNDGLTIHPTGKFTGTYFSEELKAVQAKGYKINLIDGYEFSKINLFNKFIDYFYNIKKNSKGAERFIAKLHLNTLYGYFGRSLNLLETIIIKNNKINEIVSKFKVKTIYNIDSEYSAVLINKDFNDDDISFIKSNVAIASAVTSYARIEMIKLKTYCLNNRIKIFYTDTDSIFIDKPLSSKIVGDDIGLLKDEMKGLVIKEAFFLGIKQYGYWFLDINNNRVENSVFAGVPRNCLTFKEIISISKGSRIIRIIKNRFFKSYNSLNITIKDTHLTISKSENKIMKNNIYIPKNFMKG